MMNAAQRRKLQTLRMAEGGVTFADQKTKGSTDPAIVVSLGGYGGQTLNTLRAKVNRNLAKDHPHQFLAIDSAIADLESLRSANSAVGHLRDDEVISMLDPSAAWVLSQTTRPNYIRRWLKDDSLCGVTLDDSGARQVRQIGHVMLASGDTYVKIRSMLQNKINNAINSIRNVDIHGQINMLLVAGIAGGTGSGTVIDIAYMIRDIMQYLSWTSYNLSAYLYMPDTMYSIVSDQMIRQNLKRNGYAALKEIDYFMNLENYKGKYRFSHLHGDVVSDKNIFDSCNLVSGYDANEEIKTKEEIIDCVTDTILDLLSDVRMAGMQVSRTFLSNKRAMIQTWQHIVADNPDYPQLANYGYNIIGYSNVIIPKDEIMAYCSNLVFRKVHEELSERGKADEQAVTGVMKQAGMESIDAVIERICAAANVKITEAEVLSGKRPTKKEISNSEDHTKDAFLKCVDSAMDQGDFKDGSFVEKMAAQMYGILKQQLEQAFEKKGPFFVLHVITAEKGRDGYSGILERIQEYMDPVTRQGLTDYYAKALGEADRKIMASAQAVQKKIFGVDREISNYIEDCEKAGKLYLMQRIAVDPKQTSILQAVLQAVYTRLLDKSNDIYQIYTDILEELGDILAKDAAYAADPSRSEEDDDKERFSVSVINLYDENEKTQKLKDYLESFSSTGNVAQFASAFITDMREHKAEWVDEGGNINAAERIRVLFDAFFRDKLGKDAVEKFLVVAYSQTHLSVKDLDALWKNEDSKARILKEAVKDIVDHLAGNARIMAKTNGHASYPLSRFICQQSVGLTSGVSSDFDYYLREDIMKRGLGVVVISDQRGFESRVTFSKLYIGVPLYALQGMQELDENYEECIDADGLHMDEVAEDWRRFPQPYLKDAAHVIDPEYRNKRDSGILNEVRDKLDCCIRCGAVEKGENAYILNAFKKVPEDWNTLYEQLYQELLEDSSLTLSGFLQKKTEEQVVDMEQVPLEIVDKENIHYLQQEETAKAVRQSMYLMNHVLKAASDYEELYSRYQRAKELGTILQRAADRRMLFVNAIRTVVLTRRDDDTCNAPVWYYIADRNNEKKLADLTGKTEKQMHYHLYYAFSQFCRLPQQIADQIEKAMNQNADNGVMLSRDEIRTIYEECQTILKELNNVHDYDRFNEEIQRESAGEFALDAALDKDDLGNAFRTLKGFYEMMSRRFQMKD